MSEPVRILDVGIHDGSIGAWLAEQLEGEGIEVIVDGLELNPVMVEVARKRLGKYCGEVKVGDARQAGFLFPFGTYDAVVCFEVIEHVPDPKALLAVLEQMAKPEDGRVYISTPDGTFGAGSNPNHLRVYRANDLADLLRHRGSLQDMTVGPDGITVASYLPAERRGDIAIYTGGMWQSWSPLDIERKGLGGSETAAVRLAAELSEMGYVVTVYGEVEQCCYRDVIYRHHSTFDPTVRREAVISARIPELFDRPINAPHRLLWMHDTDCGDRLTERRAEPIDHVLVLSRWHHEHVRGMYPFLEKKLRRIRNGVHLPYFEAPEGEKRQQRVVYTSSPDRGLDIMLELWPEIHERVPDAVFAYCYADVYEAVARQQPEIADFRDRIARLAKDLPKVQPLGSLPQPELARLMRTSQVWAHPSYSTPTGGPFFETFCIGAVEAQAAGCAVVAAEWGALKETVKVGSLIGIDPPGDAWRDAFVEEIVAGLTNEARQAHAQEEGPKAVAEMGWDGVARQIVGLLDGEQFAFDVPLEGAPA